MGVANIGRRLRRLRVAAGIGARPLSLAAGVSHAMVYQIEAGMIGEPGARVVLGLSEALGVSADWLLAGSGIDPNPKVVAAHFASRAAAIDTTTG